MQAYFDAGKADVALEFESPVKGPNLEQICIEVASGNTSPAAAAVAYDADVQKQAIQLNLPGW
jgi:raffinose/stachyose/melibiose transport system substrate-binding protein